METPQFWIPKKEEVIKLVKEGKMSSTSTPIETLEQKAARYQDSTTSESPNSTPLALAQEIMESNNKKLFLGPDQIRAMGMEITQDQIPPIPFTQAELIRASELGQSLTLYIDHYKDQEGETVPLTIPALEKLTHNKTKDGKKLLFNSEWYTNDPVISTETPRAGWRLTSIECIPNSKRKNYLEQTQTLISYLQNEVFQNQPLPKEYQEAIDEFNSINTPDFQKQVFSQDEAVWKQASQTLSDLKLTQLTRERFSETLYRLALHERNTGEKFHSSEYTWTATRDSDGNLVNVGDFVADGVDVDRNGPGYSHVRLGVSLSRSE